MLEYIPVLRERVPLAYYPKRQPLLQLSHRVLMSVNAFNAENETPPTR